jgi:hypothetical protein
MTESFHPDIATLPLLLRIARVTAASTNITMKAKKQ